MSASEDEILELEIARLQRAVQDWAVSRDLWHDCGFQSHLRRVKAEPQDPPVITMLYFEGPLYEIISGEDYHGLEPEFRALLAKLGYWYENQDGVTISLYAEDEGLAVRFASYFHWQWVCSLIKDDTADVYEELYRHFADRPEDLHKLHWRDFEVLLSRIFQNQGFTVELGPGRGDNGVDLRLWQRDPIGDVLTVVQAKRYAPGNKIDLTQVAALHGIADAEKADKALFVTTSSYAPVARRFTARVARPLLLAERDDVVKWCATAADGVVADKSSLVSRHSVQRLIAEVAGRRDPRIVRGRYGFALIIKESRHAALLMSLRSNVVNRDQYGQSGWEVPSLDGDTITHLNGEMVSRAMRRAENGDVSYWDGLNLYSAWNGEPVPFEFFD
jgi:hypothetical protein